MFENSKVHYIPAIPPKRDKRVGIYCRVSTNSIDKLKSLAAQVSALTRLTAATRKEKGYDSFFNINEILSR